MKFLVRIILLAALAACTQPAAPSADTTKPAQPSTPLRLNVAEIRVEDHYQPPFGRPNVEHEFAITPAASVGDWVKRNTVSSGGSGLMIANIDDASVRETILPKSGGIKGFFGGKPGSRYDAKISVTFRIYDGVTPLALTEATVQVTRSRTLKQDASSEDRDRFYDTLGRDLAQDFDTQARLQIRKYFSGYLR